MKKILLLFVLFLGLVAMSFSGPINPQKKGDPEVVQIITLKNGKVIERKLSFEEFRNAECMEDASTCTYQFANGDCRKTRSTCAKAKAAFSECACSEGYDEFCVTGNAGPTSN